MSSTSSSENAPMFFDIREKTDKEHILDNPDTYIGSVESTNQKMWVMDGEDSVTHKPIYYVPGLLKLFDEGIVNCRDHAVRMKQMVDNNVENALPVTHIDVTVEADGTITMLNDGNGCDVVQREDGVWAPEAMFARLRTSTNYNKDEEKIVGGKNGLGFKLVLIWSTYGRIETVDHVRGLKFVQEYRDNLDNVMPPVVTKCKSKPYTKVTFKPDYARLGVDGLSPDMLLLLKRRAFDIGAVTDKSVRVKYNDVAVPVRNFEQYVSMYIGADKTEAPRIYESGGDRWEYAVALTPNAEFAQVSIVNGIHTSKGGKHVEYILNQIVRKTVDYIEKKKKRKVKGNLIKEQLMLFVRCDIVNPSFDSQSKEYMTTPVAKFGSTCVVSDKFIEKLVSKLGVMNMALKLAEVKDNIQAKKTDGTKTRTLRGILKLTDANLAGTNRSHECILFLTEGDSAKAGLLSGLSSADRDTCGVYSMRGKLLNVRGESVQRIANNQEISEIKQILGLVKGKHYGSIEEVHANLRYGKVVILADQDWDGSHIKGLDINLFACEWPSLLEIPGFFAFMNTPILKAKYKDQVMCFYNKGEYEEWKQATPNTSKWTVKYYKGLGTSTGKEFKQYLAQKKLVDFVSTGQTSLDTLDMVFNKSRANDRKEWLSHYDRNAFVDTRNPLITFEEFVHRELIHFSKYDCDRNIPNLVDGLKVSQRKILYAAFKRNLVSELKVNNFGGYVSENACYHHGEASLYGTIIGMAQTFVGSNNINLLTPNGQFGTRLQGGADNASDRYIFTQLDKIAKVLFPPDDNHALKYLEDDGTPVEPLYYVPILPMVLVNGANGIGTGFSCTIPCFSPLQLVDYLQSKLRGDNAYESIDFVPYYEGFKGTITKLGEGKFLTKGLYEVIGEDTIQVNELPVGFWTDNFKKLLDELCVPPEEKEKSKKKGAEPAPAPAPKKGGKSKKVTVEEEDNECQEDAEPGEKEGEKDGKKAKKLPPIIRHFHELWTDSVVKAVITFSPGKLQELLNAKGDHGCNGLEKLLKLYNVQTTTNMHLFDAQDKLQKYETVPDIIDAYFGTRLDMYQTRKEFMLQKTAQQLKVLANKVNYIQAQLDDRLDLRKKKMDEIRTLLLEHGLEEVDDSFEYLLKMSMDSVTEEKVAELIALKQGKELELATLANTTPSQMWLSELDEFKTKYAEYIERRNAEKEDATDEDEDQPKAKKSNAKAKPKPKAEAKPKTSKPKAEAKPKASNA